VFHEVPVSNPYYEFHFLLIHAGGHHAEYEIIQGGQKMFTYPLLLCPILVIPERFAIYMNGRV
jgi:hypothetical protein